MTVVPFVPFVACEHVYELVDRHVVAPVVLQAGLECVVHSVELHLLELLKGVFVHFDFHSIDALRIVFFSPDILVPWDVRDLVVHCLLLVQDDVLLTVGQDLFDGLVAVVSQDEPEAAGLDKTLFTDPVPKGQDPLARFICLLRIAARLDYLGKVFLDRLPDRGRLVQEHVRIPFHIVLLGLGQVVRIGRVAVWLRSERMRRDAFVLIIDADGLAVIQEMHLLSDQ